MLIFFIKGVRILFSEAIKGVDAFSNSRMKLSRVSKYFSSGEAAKRVLGADKQLNSARRSRLVLVFT